MPHVPPVYRPNNCLGIAQRQVTVVVPPVYRPSSPKAVQRAQPTAVSIQRKSAGGAIIQQWPWSSSGPKVSDEISLLKWRVSRLESMVDVAPVAPLGRIGARRASGRAAVEMPRAAFITSGRRNAVLLDDVDHADAPWRAGKEARAIEVRHARYAPPQRRRSDLYLDDSDDF